MQYSFTYAPLWALAILGFLLTTSTASAQSAAVKIPDVSHLKPLYPDTLLAEDGQSRAVIVTPEGGQYRKLAVTVQNAVRSATGAELPIRSDSEFADRYGKLTQIPDINLIIIGNLETSRMVAHLYARKQCAVDAVYPGDGGYVVQTISDPWGNSVNVILLGGSTKSGIERAVQRFADKIPSGKTTRYQGGLYAEFGKDMGRRFSELSAEPTDKEIKEKLIAGDKAFRAGLHCGLFPQINSAGQAYMRTGKDGYARLFREMLFLADDLYRKDLGTYGGPWGMDADFSFADLICAWDSVEESTAISAEDRLRITNIILEYISYWESYWSIGTVFSDDIRNNHTTFTSLGFYFASDYFSKHYRLPQAEKWRKIAEGCFGAQAKSFKPQEDSNSYQWITLSHMIRYALASGDQTYLTNGNAKIGADLAIMTMDNLGYQTSFGDVGGFHGGNVEVYLWRPLAAIEQSGRYAWAYNKGILVRPSTDFYGNSTKPEEPKDLLGVRWLPTDPLFYKKWNGTGRVPQAKTFEKLTFRTSFDAEKPYLILDGISGCGHGHTDGNSILRLTDKNRIWLADCDYIKAQPKFHNMMLIFRDGQSFGLPAFSSLDLAAEMDSAGFSRTTTPGCSGTDWTRNIIWDKGRTFVVIDEIEAQVEDEFSLRCHWHTLGDTELKDNVFKVTQDGPSFAITNLDGAGLRSWDDPVMGKNWSSYKFADPVIRTLQQVHTLRMKAGERKYLLNVLSTQAKGKSPSTAQRMSDSSVLVGSGAQRALVGVNSGETEVFPGIRTDAQVYRITAGRIALGGATKLSLHGHQLFSSPIPVSVEIEAGGTMTVTAEKSTSIRITKDGLLVTVKVPAGRHRVNEAEIPQSLGIKLPVPKAAVAKTVEKVTTDEEQLSLITEFLPKSAAVGANLLNDPAKFTLIADPKPLAENALVSERVQKLDSLHDRVLAGASGSVMWAPDQKVTLTYTLKQPAALSEVSVFAWWGSTSSKGLRYLVKDINILAGASADKLSPWASLTETKDHPDWGTPVEYVLTPETAGTDAVKVVRIEVTPRPGSGVYLAEVQLRTDAKSAAAETKAPRFLSVTPDADGIIAGCTNGKTYALTPDGKVRWEFDAKSEVRAVWTGKLDKNAADVTALGTADSFVYVLDKTGKLLWKQELPYYKRIASVVYFTSADIAGDGNRVLIAGSENWHHYAFNANGEKVWQYESVHASTAGTAVDLNGDGKQEVIAGTEYYWWHAVTPDGAKLWQYRPNTGPRTTCVAAVEADGKPLVLFGGAGGYIHAVNPEGKEAWLYNTGDEISGMALDDINADGAQEIVVSSLSFNVNAVKADGTRIWRRDLGEPVLALALADLDGDGAREICVGTESGKVMILGRDGKTLASWQANGPVRKLTPIPGKPDRLGVISGSGLVILENG